MATGSLLTASCYERGNLWPFTPSLMAAHYPRNQLQHMLTYSEDVSMPAPSQKRLFQLSSLVALGGWGVLILLPSWALGPRVVLGVAVVLLCVLYGVSLFEAMTSRGERSLANQASSLCAGCLRCSAIPRRCWQLGCIFSRSICWLGCTSSSRARCRALAICGWCRAIC